MSDLLDHDAEARRKRKKIALVMAALAAIALVLALIWWGNLADSDIEEGPVSVDEALADSADD